MPLFCRVSTSLDSPLLTMLTIIVYTLRISKGHCRRGHTSTQQLRGAGSCCRTVLPIRPTRTSAYGGFFGLATFLKGFPSYSLTPVDNVTKTISDYLAELAALPASGIASIESTIPLPGQYNTHTITNKFTPATPLSPPSLLPPTVPRSEDQELSSLYFLACISMRRLLNRVHDMLYAPTTGVSPSPSRFPTVVSELSHQLDEWRDLLPEPFKFSLDTEPTQTQHGGFLRQRYLTCRSVIYRPYLTWVLENWNNGASWENGGVSQEILSKCEICLQACILHIQNLRGYVHTIMIDMWICSMSMTGGMLILTASCRIPSLRDQVSEELLTLGSHLRDLFQLWSRVPGESDASRSPSVAQSSRMIGEIEDFIKQEYQARTDSREMTRNY